MKSRSRWIKVGANVTRFSLRRGLPPPGPEPFNAFVERCEAHIHQRSGAAISDKVTPRTEGVGYIDDLDRQQALPQESPCARPSSKAETYD